MVGGIFIMFNRQDRTLLSTSSSSRRENVFPHHRGKAVGCMAGVFHLISKYHRRRKFLSSGSKRQSEEGKGKMKQTEIIKKLPAVNNTSEVPGKVVMNCSEEFVDDEDEKGRTLMEALRKCDEDLRKIQKVLEEAKAARSLSPEYKEREAEQRRQPTSFRTTNCKTPHNDNTFFRHEQHSLELKFLNQKFTKMMNTKDNIDKQNRILNATEASLLINNGCHKDRKGEATPSQLILLLRWSDKVVKESVEEIGINLKCEQKREFDKIGLILQECIYTDLIEELINVSELENKHVSSCCNFNTKNQLSRHLCKRSLRF